jgi:thiol-disulfide isomerase/thioredoxin
MATTSAVVYRARHPERTVLYRVLAQHYEPRSCTAGDGPRAFVDFWATWCAPCITEIPHYNSLYADYKDRGVSLVCLTFQSGNAETVLEWMASDPKYQMNYPLVMSNESLEEAFGPVFGFPTTLLIDRDGTIVKRWIGAAPQKSDQLRELIDEILAGNDMSEQHEGHVH